MGLNRRIKSLRFPAIDPTAGDGGPHAGDFPLRPCHGFRRIQNPRFYGHGRQIRQRKRLGPSGGVQGHGTLGLAECPQMFCDDARGCKSHIGQRAFQGDFALSRAGQQGKAVFNLPRKAQRGLAQSPCQRETVPFGLAPQRQVGNVQRFLSLCVGPLIGEHNNAVPNGQIADHQMGGCGGFCRGCGGLGIGVWGLLRGRGGECPVGVAFGIHGQAHSHAPHIQPINDHIPKNQRKKSNVQGDCFGLYHRAGGVKRGVAEAYVIQAKARGQSPMNGHVAVYGQGASGGFLDLRHNLIAHIGGFDHIVYAVKSDAKQDNNPEQCPCQNP